MKQKKEGGKTERTLKYKGYLHKVINGAKISVWHIPGGRKISFRKKDPK
jgi:hypothetical protein